MWIRDSHQDPLPTCALKFARLTAPRVGVTDWLVSARSTSSGKPPHQDESSCCDKGWRKERWHSRASRFSPRPLPTATSLAPAAVTVAAVSPKGWPKVTPSSWAITPLYAIVDALLAAIVSVSRDEFAVGGAPVEVGVAAVAPP